MLSRSPSGSRTLLKDCLIIANNFMSHIGPWGRSDPSTFNVLIEVWTSQNKTMLYCTEQHTSFQNRNFLGFLCQLTCQSADIMSSLCGVGVRVRVRVNNFFSKTTRPRDMLFFLKDTLSIEDGKLFKACKSVCSSVC